MTIFNDEMMNALEADGERLRQMTGKDHGPVFIDAGGCTECGAPLPSPSDAVCENCLRMAAEEIRQSKSK